MLSKVVLLFIVAAAVNANAILQKVAFADTGSSLVTRDMKGANFAFTSDIATHNAKTSHQEVGSAIPVITKAVVAAPVAYGVGNLGYAGHGLGGAGLLNAGHGVGFYGAGLGYGGAGYGAGLGYGGASYGAGHGLGFYGAGLGYGGAGLGYGGAGYGAGHGLGFYGAGLGYGGAGHGVGFLGGAGHGVGLYGAGIGFGNGLLH